MKCEPRYFFYQRKHFRPSSQSTIQVAQDIDECQRKESIRTCVRSQMPLVRFFAVRFFVVILGRIRRTSLVCPEDGLVRSRSMANGSRQTLPRSVVQFFIFIFIFIFFAFAFVAINALRKTVGSEKKRQKGKRKERKKKVDLTGVARAFQSAQYGAVRRHSNAATGHRHPAAWLRHHVPPASSIGVRKA